MNRLYLLIILLLGVFSAQAADFNYTYFDAAYGEVTIDDDFADIDGDGYSLSGSVAISDSIAIRAGYTDMSYDYAIDSEEILVGLEFHTPIGESTDLLLGLSVIRAEVSVDILGINVSEDDTGNVISAGIRHKLSETVEINGGISRVDVFDDSDTQFFAGLLFDVTENVSIGLGIGRADDADSFSIGIRFQ